MSVTIHRQRRLTLKDGASEYIRSHFGYIHVITKDIMGTIMYIQCIGVVSYCTGSSMQPHGWACIVPMVVDNLTSRSTTHRPPAAHKHPSADRKQSANRSR